LTCFCNLHTHTAYSFLDSISKPEDIVKKIKSMGQNAVAITDHGNVFSSVKMYKLCKEYGIKYIYGCEFYICDNRFEKDKNNKYYHITVLAKNEQGRLNINKLVSLGYLEGFYYKPRIDFDLLSQYKDGLIVLSGCMASELQRTLAMGADEKAKEIVRKYKNTFGNDYYLEIQSHKDIEQQKLNRKIVDIAKELGVEWVVTADSHYINAEDHELHSMFVQIGQEREAGETYADTQLQSEEEARNFLISLTNEEKDRAIIATQKIADKCNVEIPLSAPIIPHVKVPDKFKDENEYLKHLCTEGWIKRGIHKLPKEKIKEYKERLHYEYNAVCEMGFSGYYLLVHSYVNSVKRRGIARGSAGGSLIAYLLNIVDIDPVKFGLYFERFIDVGALDLLREGKIQPEELKIPDVDTDFGTSDREKVIKFIEETYGSDRFASIGSFQYIWDKSAIKDVGRVMQIPFEITNEITKVLGDDEIDDALNSGKLNKYVEKYPKLFEYAKKLTGLPRQFSMHPCGKIISTSELTNYTAILNNDGVTVLQCDMEDAEALGLVKVDTLGLRTIDVIYDVLEMIGEDYEYINPAKLNLNEPKVYEIFQNGYTDGIFQFESEGMKSVLRKMKPTTIDDLAIANALFRPGSMKYIDNYINRKHGIESFEYLHPDLEPILKPTYGIIIFQEQLIDIGRLAGMRNPDEIRQATAKKKIEKMIKVEPELKNGLLKRGWTQEQVDKLWNDILEFAKYSFNKSHSYAYALTAYVTAYLKAFHPKEYMCALINSYEGKRDKIAATWSEVKRMGIKIEPFNFRNAKPLCEIEHGNLIIGTSIIKGCNRQIAYDLQKFKDKHYDTFVELLVDIEENTSIQSDQMLALIRLGFFSEFGETGKLYLVYNEFKNGKNKYSKTHQQKTKEKRIIWLMEFERKTENIRLKANAEINYQIEYLGGLVKDYSNAKGWYLVREINTTNAPKLTLYSLETCEERIFKMQRNDYFKKDPALQIEINSLIKLIEIEYKNKLKYVDGQFVPLDEKEPWIKSYVKYSK